MRTLKLFNVLYVLILFCVLVFDIVPVIVLVMVGISLLFAINIVWKRLAQKPDIADVFSKLDSNHKNRRTIFFLAFLVYFAGPAIALITIPWKNWNLYMLLGAAVGLTLAIFHLVQALKQKTDVTIEQQENQESVNKNS